MKNLKSPTLIVLLLFASFISAMAQENTNSLFNNKKTEINIGFSDIFAKDNYIYPYYYYDQYSDLSYYYFDDIRRPSIFVGVKLHDKKGAFRISTNMHYNSAKNENQNNTSEITSIKNVSLKLNLGYEWHTTYNRVNIYYGFDLSTSMASTNYKSEYKEQYSGQILKTESKMKETAIGINPLIGVSFFVAPSLSIGTEFKLFTEYFSGNDKSFSNSINVSEHKTSGFRTSFGPLGFLSVNIHL